MDFLSWLLNLLRALVAEEGAWKESSVDSPEDSRDFLDIIFIVGVDQNNQFADVVSPDVERIEFVDPLYHSSSMLLKPPGTHATVLMQMLAWLELIRWRILEIRKRISWFDL